MKGDIAQRSIRSSMSRLVDARLPRMISSVMGSTRVGSGMDAIQEEITRRVDACREARRDQRRRVVLLDDGGAHDLLPILKPRAVVGGRHEPARAAEVDATLARLRLTGRRPA